MNRMLQQDELRPARDTHAPAAEPERLPPPPRRGLWLRLLVAVLLLVAAALTWRWMMATAPTHLPRTAQEKEEPVRVSTARLVDAAPEWILYGTAVSPQRVVIRPAVSGTVVETASGLRDGAAVTAGQVLVRIDDADYRIAVRDAEAALAEARARREELAAQLELERGALRRAKEQLAIARRELARVENLARRGVAPEATLDQRRLTVSQSRQTVAQHEANLRAVQARLKQQEATTERLTLALEKARRNLADTVLRAPVSGIATAVTVARGQQAGLADRLLTIVSDEPREVRLALSERRYGALKAAGERILGRPVLIVWDTAGGLLRLNARIVRVTPAVAEGRGVVYLHARIEDAGRAAWLPDGAFVEVRMKGPRQTGVALLPEAALYDNARVYVVRDGRMRPFPVRLLGHVGDKVMVAGLKGGERIIVSRIAEPVPGRKVRLLDER